MSQNTFPTNPIFYLPIDLEESSNTETVQNNISQESISFSSIDNKSEDDNNDKNIIIFSLNKNDRNIKSMTNSSKIYTSEIFKKNWKLKSKRLITKLKIKLIKQWKNYEKNNLKNNSNILRYNNINEIIINSKNINSKFDINNYYINNNINNLYRINNNNCYNILNNIVYNNRLNINNLDNINININKNLSFNQSNNLKREEYNNYNLYF